MSVFVLARPSVFLGGARASALGPSHQARQTSEPKIAVIAKLRARVQSMMHFIEHLLEASEQESNSQRG